MNALDERLEGPAKRAGPQAVLGLEGLGPSEHAGRVVHVPDPDVGVLQRKPRALFGGSQGLDGAFTFRDVLRHDQRGRLSGKRDRMRRDLHVDDLAGS